VFYTQLAKDCLKEMQTQIGTVESKKETDACKVGEELSEE
jgi:hypothetical protein